jgi:hypothetical protein
VIDAETPGYLRAACDYVHLNPARAGLVGEAEALENWRWSSYPQYLRKPQLRSEWLRTDRLLGEHGIGSDNIRGRRELAARLDPGEGESQLEQDKQAAELSDARRSQVGGGGRSEKIRTYNFKENRVTDHRIGFTMHQLDAALGQLFDLAERQLIQAMLAAPQRSRHLHRVA